MKLYSFTCPICDYEFEYDENWHHGQCPSCKSEYLVSFDCNDPHDAVLIPDFEPFKQQNMSKKLKEIERKWLLKAIPSVKYTKSKDILQFYTEENFRYRRETDISTGDITYYKIKKTSIGHGTNEEEIFSCDVSEFLLELPNAVRSIHKLRSIHESNGLFFEIDTMHKPALVMLEVELDDINQKVELPEEIQKMVILEVTGMKEFSNYNLCMTK